MFFHILSQKRQRLSSVFFSLSWKLEPTRNVYLIHICSLNIGFTVKQFCDTNFKTCDIHDGKATLLLIFTCSRYFTVHTQVNRNLFSLFFFHFDLSACQTPSFLCLLSSPSVKATSQVDNKQLRACAKRLRNASGFTSHSPFTNITTNTPRA